jgi:hypothetical protein
MKWVKGEREKQKNMASGVAVFLFIWWEQFPL